MRRELCMRAHETTEDVSPHRNGKAHGMAQMAPMRPDGGGKLKREPKKKKKKLAKLCGVESFMENSPPQHEHKPIWEIPVKLSRIFRDQHFNGLFGDSSWGSLLLQSTGLVASAPFTTEQVRKRPHLPAFDEAQQDIRPTRKFTPIEL